MEYNLLSFENILKEFEYLPKINSNPTFMDICHLGRDRFEERCSQILSFYFSPLQPHKLKGLVLNSLLELLDINNSYNPDHIEVKTEETTQDLKRIDITIVADDFVICIENKIGASVYNPLESYKTYIDEKYESKSYKYYVVLSAKRITNSEELKKIGNCDFIYVNYSDLFAKIKKNLGLYMMDCDQSYLTYLLDFMRTIEKRFFYMNMENIKFYLKNREKIEELKKFCESTKNAIFERQCGIISELKNKLFNRHGIEWDIWEGFDLVMSFSGEIGIESWFENDTVDNPLGDFHIYITMWHTNDFGIYKDKLIEVFGNNFKEIMNNGRPYIEYCIVRGPIDPQDQEKTNIIIETLTDCYKKLKEITDNIK